MAQESVREHRPDAPAEGGRRRPGPRSRRPAASRPPFDLRRHRRLAPLVVPVVAFTWAACSRAWMQEDGFINLRIVQQLLAGHGPVYNTGERVEAYTSPLWIFVLAVLRVVTLALVPLEWLAVIAGIGLAVAGTVLVLVGSVALWTPPGRRAGAVWWLPVGALVPVVLAASWEFASSGLETGLSVAWLGAAFAGVAVAARRSEGRGRVRWIGLAVLIGLGPLVRPEITLYSVGFALAAWFAAVRPAREAGRTDVPSTPRLVAALLGVPVAYQLFRMGYFATLVPTTALAKNASTIEAGRGVTYLTNFLTPYHLIVPLLIVVVLVAVDRPFRRRSTQIVAAGIVIPAIANVGYVIAIGGDYMHGRFWLVPLTALLSPVAALPLPRRRAQQAPRLAALALVAGWALLCAGLWRPTPIQGEIQDQRAIDIKYFHEAPVRVGDQPAVLLAAGHDFHSAAGRDVFLDRLNLVGPPTLELPRNPGAGTAARYDAIGITGYVAGRNVFIVDRFGLADPVAARLPVVNESRAGHTHDLPVPWRDARGGVLASAASPDTRAAERAMTCGDLGRLLRGIHGPLTVGRFFSNLLHAPADTTLKIPGDPYAAERKYCGSNSAPPAGG